MIRPVSSWGHQDEMGLSSAPELRLMSEGGGGEQYWEDLRIEILDGRSARSEGKSPICM